MNTIKDNNQPKRGMRAKLNLFEDTWFEPRFKITKSHTDENGVLVIDEFQILGVDLAKGKDEE